MPHRHNHTIPYSTDELFACGPMRTFTGDALREIAFPLGGIGTGCISLGGSGQLRDWEIFNRPDQGYAPEFTFVSLRAQAKGQEPITKVVQSPFVPPFTGPFGGGQGPGKGLPHFESSTFRGEYPFAWLDFTDARMPLKVSLEAFSPFIPRNDYDSSLPVAILIYRLENTSDVPVKALLAATCENPVGHVAGRGYQGRNYGKNRNLFRSEEGLSGMVMDSLKFPEDDPQFGSVVMATTAPSVTYTGSLELLTLPDTFELEPAGFAVGHHFWEAVHAQGRFDDRERSRPTDERRTSVCALGVNVNLKPGESVEVPLIFTWYFPNYTMGTHLWDGQKPAERPPQWRNYYGTQFKSAWDVASYVHSNFARLRQETRMFHDALFSSTLPAVALDAASSQASTLKTCTCLRLEDGTFYGFEGCGNDAGCCHGSCTHVWNYQQALPFLFPALERSMRTADYKYNLREEDGRMCFRIGLPLGTSHWGFHACVDGQLGGIIKTYRDWLLCGDDEWLRQLWPSLKKALAYTWVQWDPDRDGVIDGIQHNTYDIEFQGPNPLSGAFYMGALRAAEEMARYLGDDEAAEDYRRLFEKGSAKLDELVFNGEYYYQIYDPEKVTSQQFGEGCLSDQMLGQWLASICNLGYLFKPENVRTALSSVFKFNWRASLADHANAMRIYALGDEAGLLVTSWPHGNRPLVPTMYSDEVWTGMEYQVASHLALEGFVEQALAIVKGARDRHDGRKRNPWDEPECGSHYSRAMSSWGLITALSGYFSNASQGLMQFAPKVWQDDFRSFWSNDAAWGTYSQKLEEGAAAVKLEVLHGEQTLKVLRLKLDMPEGAESASAKLNGRAVKCSAATDGEWTELRFEKPLRIAAGKSLTARLEA